MRALSTPELLDDLARGEPALWRAQTPPDIKDRAQIAIARHVLMTRWPDLALVRIFRLDDAQHEHRPWSPEVRGDDRGGPSRRSIARSARCSATWSARPTGNGRRWSWSPITASRRSTTRSARRAFAKHGLVRGDAESAVTEDDVGVIASGGSARFYALEPK